MPRMARLVVPEYPHHVVQRGNRRQAVFIRDDDWSRYLDLVRAACLEVGTRVLAYCLRPNHVHFVMVPEEEGGVRAAMADAHRRYTKAVNFREGWRGHLWQERFHSFVTDEAHLHATIPYVEGNPVRAGLSDTPAKWRWSSAAEHAGSNDTGLVDWNQRGRLLDVPSRSELNAMAQDVEDIRRYIRTGRLLGSNSFVERIEEATGRTLRRRKPGPKPASQD